MRATISDRKLADTLATGEIDTMYADVASYQHFYPFGMLQPGRNYNAPDYRYGFNGMEADEEVLRSKNNYTTYFRQYDARLGRWWSTDPKGNAALSEYNAMRDNPIFYTDPVGDTVYVRGQSKDYIRSKINLMRDQSTLFNIIFSELHSSKHPDVVSLDETMSNPGKFVSYTNKGGGEIFFRSKTGLNTSIIIGEEFSHAYQEENLGLYDSNKEFNREFEAKVMALFIRIENKENDYGALSTIKGSDKLAKNLEVPSLREVKHPDFQIHYQLFAEFRKKYEKDNTENKRYKKKTEENPESLEKLIRKKENQHPEQKGKSEPAKKQKPND